MKKTYLRPEADYINFYSEEEMTVDGGVSGVPEGGFGEGTDAPDEW